MIIAMSLTLAGTTDAPLVRQTVVLRCGAADLSVTNSVSTSRTASVAPVRQTLTRRVGVRTLVIPLERGHATALDGGTVQDRYLASWACVAGRNHSFYVLLGYACTADPGQPGDCGGQKEWFRLLDERGRLADQGVPQDGAARDRFNSRIGIAGAMAAGVTMTPVVR